MHYAVPSKHPLLLLVLQLPYDSCWRCLSGYLFIALIPKSEANSLAFFISIRWIMFVTRGIRGAISVEEDRSDCITSATGKLLDEILHSNPGIQPQYIASIIFTMTDDLTSANPATAARQTGWEDVPLMCAREINISASMPRVIRILVHWNTDLPQSAIHHVYLGRAAALRPDLARTTAG